MPPLRPVLPLLVLAAAFRLDAGPCAELPPRLFHPLVVPDRFDGRSPTRFHRTAHFSSACQGLNLCFARLGSFRGECEQAFGEELAVACERAYDGFWEGEARARCRLAVRRLRAHLEETREDAWRDAGHEKRRLEDTGPRRVPRRYRKWITGDEAVPRR